MTPDRWPAWATADRFYRVAVTYGLALARSAYDAAESEASK